jgi:Na+/H+-dicarboxylate symporter
MKTACRVNEAGDRISNGEKLPEMNWETIVLAAVTPLIGAGILILWVNVFRMLAGVTFRHWRHVVTAYLVALCVMLGNDRFASEYATAMLLAGACYAVMLELWLLYRRMAPLGISHKPIGQP